MRPDLVLRRAFWRAYVSGERRERELRYLFLEVTKRCNLSCRHCGSDCSSKRPDGELSAAEWITVVDDVRHDFGPGVVFVISGGEPLVFEGLFPLLGHIKSLGMRAGMVTNGFSLDERVIAGLESVGLYSITISLDGPEIPHTALRRHPDSWRRAIKALRLVAGSSIPVHDAVTCVFPANVDRLEETGELLASLGVKSWRMFRIFPKGRAAAEPELCLSIGQTRDMLDFIRDARPRFAKKGLNLSYSCELFLPFDLDLRVRREPFFCRSGINIASVLSDGRISGCSNNADDFIEGDIRLESLRTVWEREFSAFRERTQLKRGPCAACRHWSDCSGGPMHLRRRNDSGPDFCLVAGWPPDTGNDLH
ncbi:MAG: radical SAM protein [Spirochaetes bacterium]|nr:radical SAM protein [Spirochaetota bacterium]